MFLNHAEYIYKDYSHLQNVETCEKINNLTNGPIPTDIQTFCDFNDQNIIVYHYGQKYAAIRYDQVILFTYSQENKYRMVNRNQQEYLVGSLDKVSYNPNDMIDPGAPIPERAYKILGKDF